MKCKNCNKPIVGDESGSWWIHTSSTISDRYAHLCDPWNNKGKIAEPMEVGDVDVAHDFVGKREYGLQPKPDHECVQCGIRYASHMSSGMVVDVKQLADLKADLLKAQIELVKLATKTMVAELDYKSEQQRSAMFREEASKLYDIKGWLRLCDNDPEGHKEFYEWASHIIWPDTYPAPGEPLEDEDEDEEIWASDEDPDAPVRSTNG